MKAFVYPVRGGVHGMVYVCVAYVYVCVHACVWKKCGSYGDATANVIIVE